MRGHILEFCREGTIVRKRNIWIKQDHNSIIDEEREKKRKERKEEDEYDKS